MEKVNMNLDKVYDDELPSKVVSKSKLRKFIEEQS